MSEWSQRRKVSVDTPAAVASSDLSIAFIGFRSNFPQLLSAFLGTFRLHSCNDPGDGGETFLVSGFSRCFEQYVEVAVRSRSYRGFEP